MKARILAVVVVLLGACGSDDPSPEAEKSESTGAVTSRMSLEDREALDMCKALDEAREGEPLTSAESIKFGEALAVAERSASEPVGSAAGALLENLTGDGGNPNAAQELNDACEEFKETG